MALGVLMGADSGDYSDGTMTVPIALRMAIKDCSDDDQACSLEWRTFQTLVCLKEILATYRARSYLKWFHSLSREACKTPSNEGYGA